MGHDNTYRQCETCKGTGQKLLTGVYMETLVLLRRQRVAVYPAALAAMMKCKPEAMANRLSALERMGLATSERYGKLRLYKAK